MACDLRTSWFIVIEGNGFLKLKGFFFLRHDHFACKATQFALAIKRQHFGLQRFKTIKGQKIKLSNLHFTLF
jgi:hypothetical protein